MTAYLEPATASWRGTVGLFFTNVADFKAYLATLQRGSFRAQGIVLHNTAAPNYRQWQATTPSEDPIVDGKQRLKNIAHGYRIMGWAGGPHLFVVPEGWWIFNPLTERGTHSPSWNATHFGIEMVGDFNVEPFNPQIRDNTVAVMAALCEAFGFDLSQPSQFHFHKEDPRSDHDCPGKNVDKVDMTRRVHAFMVDEDSHEHVVEPSAPIVAVAPKPVLPPPTIADKRRAAFDYVFKDEGGYAERATEGGGAVNMGITFDTFVAWRGVHGLPAPTFADLKAMPRDVAEQIYYEEYLEPVHFDELPIGVGYAVYDAAVLGGVSGSIKILQQVLGFKGEQVDGFFSLQDRWAANHRDVPKLINGLCDRRLAVYAGFRNASVPVKEGSTRTWGDVWKTRIELVRERALKMSGGGSA